MTSKRNIVKIVALAVGLPSTILGVFFFIYFLMENKYISTEIALILILLFVAHVFYLMIRYAIKK